MVKMYGDDSFLAFSVADSDEENVISPPPPRRSHQRHRKVHQTFQTQEVDMEAEDGVMPEVHVPHHQESLLDKLERGAQVVGVILPPVTILVLVIYILCAGMCYANNFYLLCF
jgi:hypothetical protein